MYIWLSFRRDIFEPKSLKILPTVTSASGVSGPLWIRTPMCPRARKVLYMKKRPCKSRDTFSLSLYCVFLLKMSTYILSLMVGDGACGCGKFHRKTGIRNLQIFCVLAQRPKAKFMLGKICRHRWKRKILIQKQIGRFGHLGQNSLFLFR